MDDFERHWKEFSKGENPKEDEEEIEDTPDYQIRDGIARLNILADILCEYYYSKHGQPLPEPADEVKFRLK